MGKRIRRTMLSSVVIAVGLLLIIGAAGMSDANLEMSKWGSQCIVGVLMMILGYLIGGEYER